MAKNNDKIGLVYHPDYLLHTHPQHPERKDRLEYINAAINNRGPEEHIEWLDPEPAEVEDINLIHDYEYIRSIEEACLAGKRFLDMDTYITSESYRVALLSAGAALTGLRRIMEGRNSKAFALNRPPGHHAERRQAMGFCLFNNIAVAAAAAKRDYGLKRIAIVDWDVHHGNGTQHAFEEDNEVLFISTHQSPAYPGTGPIEEVGRGKGQGFNVNIPLPAGTGDADYDLVFKQVVIPVLEQFQPELLLISAGHDAYRHDPLAGMALTQQGYFNMADQLLKSAERWCKGKVLLCLEGGYHLKGQAEIVVQVLNALGRWGLPFTEETTEREANWHIQKRLQDICAVQRSYWQL
ncbi:MAG: histone deacetylase [Bacillota bacterium]